MGAPLSYVVNAPRTSEMVSWLRCNDVDPNEVPYTSQVFVETLDGERWFIRFEVYGRDAAGFIAYDQATEQFVYAERSVGMLNDPPMWWLEEVAPTGVRSHSSSVTRRSGDFGE